MYPPDWTLSDWRIARGDNASFDLSTGASVDVFMAWDRDNDDPRRGAVGTNDQAALNDFAAMLAEVWSSEGDFVLQDKSVWKNRGYCVRFMVDTKHYLAILIPLDQGFSVNLLYFGRDDTITQEKQSAVDLLLSTLHVKLPIDTEPFEPMQTTEETGTERSGTIEVLDWTWYESSTGRYIHIDGEVQNVSPRTLEGVHVYIKLLDANEKLLGIDSGYTEPSTIEPGGKALFSIMARNMPGLEWVHISQITWR